MMKGQTRNIETFRVGSTKVDEFAFHKHQGEMREHAGDAKGEGFGKTETRAEEIARVVKEAHEKVLRRKRRR